VNTTDLATGTGGGHPIRRQAAESRGYAPFPRRRTTDRSPPYAGLRYGVPLRLFGPTSYPELVLDLDKLDVDEIATALSDQTQFEHLWLIDPRTGAVLLDI
jgi:hypothetical protein